jgi:DNA-binding transcriptional LysR family regulator
MHSSLERTNFLSLQLFLAIVERGSIAEAARQSFIAPTAVTKRMQELEDDFGVTLLVRTSKGVLPTAAGLALAQNVRAMTNLSSRMHTEMQDYAKGAYGHVRIVANASALIENLAEEIAGYMSSHPGIRIDIEEAHSGDVVKAVRDGNADIGVFAPPAIASPGLDVCQYRSDRLAVAVPSDHPLASRKDVAFAELCDYPLIGVHGASSLSILIAQAAGGKAPSFRAASNDVARWMVSKNLGITVLPEELILPFEMALGLRAVAITDPWAQRTLQLCVRNAETLSAAARALFRALRPKDQVKP